MRTNEDLVIGDKALQIYFLRTKIGKEFRVAARLKKRFTQKKNSTPKFFCCFGQYDLIEFTSIDSHDSIYKIPFDLDITDCEFSLFYSWANVTQDINSWLAGVPALIMVLLKIQPAIEEKLGLKVETKLLIPAYIMSYFRRKKSGVCFRSERSKVCFLCRAKP